MIASWRAEFGERNVTHGHSRERKLTPTYSTWLSIIDRCERPYTTKYPDYGGRGICICDRWKEFANFLADMGERPDGCTIERNDVNGHYEPGNCRWATLKEQARNKRNNHRLTFNGETLCLAEWGERLGIGPLTLLQRVRRGWPVERVLTTAVGRSPMR